MKQSHLTKLRQRIRQAGQGMTEYIIIVAVIAIGSIAVYTAFGDTLRGQVAMAAMGLSGQTGAREKVTNAATTADGATSRNLTNFTTGAGGGGGGGGGGNNN